MAYEIIKNFIPGLPQIPYDGGVGKYIGVVAHATDNIGDSSDGERSYESRTFNDAFVHFLVDDTKILQAADINYICYGAGHTANHHGYVQVELCETKDQAKFEAAFAKYTWLLAHLLFIKGLPVVEGSTLMSHAQVSASFKETSHTDPIEYLKMHGKTWGDVVNGVIANYTAMKGSVTSVSTADHSVLALQKALNKLGYKGKDGKALAEDGQLGPNTKFATQVFQKTNGLVVDGDAGVKTWEALDKALSAKPVQQPIQAQHLYRVRKSWDDSESQISANKDLSGAKGVADKNTGYKVFDEKGNCVYAPVAQIPATKPKDVSKTVETEDSIKDSSAITVDIPANLEPQKSLLQKLFQSIINTFKGGK